MGGSYSMYRNRFLTMTILHVDDDKDDRELLAEALEQIDPSICCINAHDGQELLSMLQQNKILPDYIFLDVNMPLMDGRQCLAELKKDKKLKNIPVVIYSTTTNTQEIRDLSELGACDFLSKANSFGELCVSLNLMIEKLKSLRISA
jgi:CheY-like chemotaxis protein